MILEFSNSRGERRVIGHPTTLEDCNSMIQNFLNDHNFKSYYTRINYYPDKWEFDVGSHSEFFYLSEIPNDISSYTNT